MDPYRIPNPWERAVLRRLALEAPVEGASYAAQVDVCKVRAYDEDGDLEVFVPESAPRVDADIEKAGYYLAEQIYLDSDGAVVSLMLHGRKGALGYLEWYKGEGKVLNRNPDLRDIRSVEGTP